MSHDNFEEIPLFNLEPQAEPETGGAPAETLAVEHSGNLPKDAGQELPVEEFDTSLRQAHREGLIGQVPKDPGILVEAQQDGKTSEKVGLLGTKGRKAGAAGIAVAALLGTFAGIKAANGPSEANEVSVSQPAAGVSQSPTPKDAETTQPSPTDIPKTTAPTTAETTASSEYNTEYEKGSVEYYQVMVEDYPEASDAVKRIGRLMTQFETSGEFDENTGNEATDSVHADDNMLAAIFGENFEENNPVLVDVERQMRTTISRVNDLIKGYTTDPNPLIYHVTYSPFTGTTKQFGDITTIEVEMRASSNVSKWLNASLDAQKHQQISLEKISNSQGEEVWQLAKIINLE